ncbi:hypothetical protein [Paenibacillus polymyxa]|uniref:hypothetical protein n=1 Tax=Paenibacillus polymyxa TaxID=1406 RepID=UPI002034C237|nr:hypothetical protein [Paenibacillus polymyxa]
MRFVLKDAGKADLNALNQLEGVLKAQNSVGQVQVVIGAKVDAVYSEVKNLTSDHIGELTESTDSGPKKRRNPVNVVLETIAAIFTPVLPVRDDQVFGYRYNGIGLPGRLRLPDDH